MVKFKYSYFFRNKMRKFFEELTKDINERFKEKFLILEQESMDLPKCASLGRLPTKDNPDAKYFCYCALEFPYLLKLSSTDFLCIPHLKNHCMRNFETCSTYLKDKKHIDKK